MLEGIFLTAALAIGQPAQPMPMPIPGNTPAPLKVESQPTTPTAQPTIIWEQPANGYAEAASEEQAKTKYLLERLTQDTFLGQRGIKLYGWTEMSYNASSASRTNRPVAFNDEAGNFQLNQNWLGIAKEVDPTKKEFQLGFRTEAILPGTDARFTLIRGFMDEQLRSGPGGGPKHYPIDIYQFYTEAFLPTVGPEGTTVRVGRFATHCSYEVTQGVDTPFLSRSYLFLVNPFTHTGIWAITPLSDELTIANGVALGSDNFIDETARLNYLGQIKWAPKNGKNTWIFNTVITDPRFNVREAFAQYNVYNLQLIRKMNDCLTYVLDSTYSHTYDVPGLGYADWYGAAQYLFWKHTDTLTSQLRVELFNDVKGFRTGGEGLYTGVTYGPAWTPMNWLMVRPSVRYDHNNTANVFEGSRDLFTMTIDLIARW